jgi:hypothetical protein
MREILETTSQQTATAVVARGRSIDVPHSTKRETLGLHEDGKLITRAVTQQFIAGEEVELLVDEIAGLRALGYLVNPDNAPPPSEFDTNQ